MSWIRSTRGLILTALCLALAHSPLFAQLEVDWDPGRLEVTREALLELERLYQEVMASEAYSEDVRTQAERDLDAVRERLTMGDFRMGDRIALTVVGEAALSDTLHVEPGPSLQAPVVGAISLKGVLRSELNEHLTRELSRFVQNPRVFAKSLVRLSIQGELIQPGFYTVPADALLSEALMVAGGPSQEADLDGLIVERGPERLWHGEDLENAIIAGWTIDQLGLRGGDQILLPAQFSSSIWTFGRYMLIVGSSLLLGTQILF
ncbi:MAG: hypothetical protein HKO53_10495 [Gemmatimonadetes bacterium]|nr:hypothetical protein [Gemmatimonadota bacterium]NNM33486.1 hypothetical protein [Gemmatimonadota bacterium]